jgi:hypothetical protein
MRFLLFSLLIPTLTACGGAGTDAPNVQIEAFHFKRLPGGARVLSGTLYNPTPEPVHHAQIQVSLFDADNRRISTMMIVVDEVAPGGRKRFRRTIDSDLDVRGARVRSILVL